MRDSAIFRGWSVGLDIGAGKNLVGLDVVQTAWRA